MCAHRRRRNYFGGSAQKQAWCSINSREGHQQAWTALQFSNKSVGVMGQGAAFGGRHGRRGRLGGTSSAYSSRSATRQRPSMKRVRPARWVPRVRIVKRTTLPTVEVMRRAGDQAVDGERGAAKTATRAARRKGREGNEGRKKAGRPPWKKGIIGYRGQKYTVGFGSGSTTPGKSRGYADKTTPRS